MGELVNEFSWSRSRDAQFQECRRAYWLGCYAFWGGWMRGADPAVRELYIMKNLHTRATWIGTVVHEVAEQTVKTIRAGRPLPPLEVAQQGLERRMRQDLSDSAAQLYRKEPKKKPGFVEDYYHEEWGSEDQEDAIETARECVRTFYSSAVLARLTEVGPPAILSVEDLESFQVDGVKVWVKMDLVMAGRDGGRVIVDWKTGTRHDPEEVGFQLGIYGLFGVQTWGVPASSLRSFDFNLRDGAHTTHRVDEAALAGVEQRIRTSIAAMKGLLRDPTRNQGHIDDFPMTDDLSRCRRCRFRGACGRT